MIPSGAATEEDGARKIMPARHSYDERAGCPFEIGVDCRRLHIGLVVVTGG
jgi:hypothetical protein